MAETQPDTSMEIMLDRSRHIESFNLVFSGKERSLGCALHRYCVDLVPFLLLLLLSVAIQRFEAIASQEGATGFGAYRSPCRLHHGKRVSCLWNPWDFLGQIGLG